MARAKRRAPKATGMVALATAASRAREIARDLYPHQVEGVGFLLGRRRSILADDMGLGKTRQSIIAMTEAEPVGPWLVVCPASVKHNWIREIRLALGEAQTWVIGPGPPPMPGFAGWIVVNYDLLKRDIDALLDHRFTGIVFDEGHYLKNHRAQRSRLARRLVVDRDFDPVVHVLTGTPLTNRPRDLFPLLQLVGHALGHSFLAFAKRYCDGHKNDYGYWVTAGASNIPELSVQLQGIMLRRNKDEVLDLPAKQRTWIEVDVDAEVRERLNDAVGRFLSGERDGRGRRLGIAMFSGARRRLAVAKVPQTLDYVRGAIDQGEKILLFSCFTHATRRFQRALGELAVTITGEVPTPKRLAIVDRFQHDDSVRVLIGQIHAAGVGINLTAARQVVFNDLDWVPANHWQAEDRTHRIGQTGTVNVTYMVARYTLEEFIRRILETKARIVDDVVEGKALGEAMESDVLVELRRMATYLDDAAQSRSEDLDQAAIEDLLRAASERYIAENGATMTRRARRELKPVSDRAIEALAEALAGPARVVYAVPSATDPKAHHRVEVEGADINCDCKGFMYRGMCRHVRDLKNALATGKPVPAAYRLLGTG